MVGVESLVRWNHRVDGMVLPEYFLPAAEESGAIVPLGNWVIRQSCHQLREWLTSGLKIFASVNLSKRQLLQADLVEIVTRELRDQGIAPDYFMVEIAEGFNTFNPDMMDKVVNDLGSSGIRIAIDDFGIGYSSLSRLNLTHTKIIKIDRSIIQGCPNDKQCSTIAVAAINLANSLGLWSLAEGVENANQLKFLTKYNCSLAQGFYFQEPVVAADIAALHKSKKTWKV
jgi:EAL domain-containing protein (putative c-di-GMP-specific phosphodiesterase class I)